MPWKQWGKESSISVCGRIALLSRWVTQIDKMAEGWYGLLKDMGFDSQSGPVIFPYIFIMFVLSCSFIIIFF